MMQRLQQKLTKKTNKNFNEPNVPKLKRYELSQSNCTDIDEKVSCFCVLNVCMYLYVI